jgi:hypothetical protein
MKLSAYIVAVDSGFSPNPFGGRCTLACCKPSIRRNAGKDDVIIGTGSAASGLAGQLIYAMRVGEVIPYREYWDRFPSRRPSARSPIASRGDNIWHQDDKGRWHVVRGALHTIAHRDRDLGGLNVLIASELYYFGREAIPIPGRFAGVLATTQGHKNTEDESIIRDFWRWLSTRPRGLAGLPSAFDKAGCCVERAALDDDCTA